MTIIVRTHAAAGACAVGVKHSSTPGSVCAACGRPTLDLSGRPARLALSNSPGRVRCVIAAAWSPSAGPQTMLQAALRRQTPACLPGLIAALRDVWQPQEVRRKLAPASMLDCWQARRRAASPCRRCSTTHLHPVAPAIPQVDQLALQHGYSTISSGGSSLGLDPAPSGGGGSRGAATSAAAYAALLPSLRLSASTSPLQLSLAVQLQTLVQQASMSNDDAAELCSAAAALGPTRQCGLINHSSAVAAWMQEQGLPAAQLAALLRRCPYLFSWPVERAAQRFAELAGLGLAPAEAALCFERCPAAASTSSFEDVAAVLAALFHAGRRASDGRRSGQLLLGDLLRQQPAALGLLMMSAGTVQQRLSSLRRQFRRHWAPKAPAAVIVTALRKQHGWCLLKLPAQHCAALEQLLQQQLGRRPGDGARLLAAVLEHKPQAVRCSLQVMGGRVQQLRQVRGTTWHAVWAGCGGAAALVGCLCWLRSSLEGYAVCLTGGGAFG